MFGPVCPLTGSTPWLQTDLQRKVGRCCRVARRACQQPASCISGDAWGCVGLGRNFGSQKGFAKSEHPLRSASTRPAPCGVRFLPTVAGPTRPRSPRGVWLSHCQLLAAWQRSDTSPHLGVCPAQRATSSDSRRWTGLVQSHWHAFEGPRDCEYLSLPASQASPWHQILQHDLTCTVAVAVRERPRKLRMKTSTREVSPRTGGRSLSVRPWAGSHDQTCAMLSHKSEGNDPVTRALLSGARVELQGN
mmetsp:Transcript_69239/g.152829  ORF Transcript_69239/g.152829 Transcript_69239/m.152829 type:complete len:247 (+) Transcript_69239:48-788(+)